MPDEKDYPLSPIDGPPPDPTPDDGSAQGVSTIEGRYVLGEEIARDGMGIVYLADDKLNDRRVAVKVALPGRDTERFRQEFRAAVATAGLRHPGIPSVHEEGTLPDGRPFLAMELIRGRTLDEVLRAGDRLDVPAVFEKVCRAVGHLHSRGIIHRSLNPGSVMIEESGEVKVTDWGPASFPRGAPATTPDAGGKPHTPDDPTRAGLVLGRSAYMAPEQARGLVHAVGPQTDVFGLGGILCEMLTGRPVYAGESPSDVKAMAADAQTTGAFVRLDASGADPELVALCKRCLAADPAVRPADGNAVAAAVAAVRRTDYEKTFLRLAANLAELQLRAAERGELESSEMLAELVRELGRDGRGGRTAPSETTDLSGTAQGLSRARPHSPSWLAARRAALDPRVSLTLTGLVAVGACVSALAGDGVAVVGYAALTVLGLATAAAQAYSNAQPA